MIFAEAMRCGMDFAIIKKRRIRIPHAVASQAALVEAAD
jgi:hypothetical protein